MMGKNRYKNLKGFWIFILVALVANVLRYIVKEASELDDYDEIYARIQVVTPDSLEQVLIYPVDTSTERRSDQISLDTIRLRPNDPFALEMTQALNKSRKYWRKRKTGAFRSSRLGKNSWETMLFLDYKQGKNITIEVYETTKNKAKTGQGVGMKFRNAFTTKKLFYADELRKVMESIRN